MRKEKPTKVYKGASATDTNKSSKGVNKSGGNPFENIVKAVKYIIAKALAGSTKHIAILACGVLITVAVVGGAVYGVTQIAGNNGPSVEFNEIEIDPEADNNYNKDEAALDKDKFSATILGETEDAGQEYIDGTLFIGDSNTVRSLMYEATGTTWENVVGIVGIGVQHVASVPQYKINFAGMSQPVDILTAVTMIQPQRIIMTFGTNNATWDVASFIEEYSKAAHAIYNAYPYSDIIVNAIPPVDRLRDYPNITMQQIDKFNLALAEMCEKEGWKFLDSTEVLKDEETGFAKKDYTISDGIHLSKNGFEALFDYIRTHAYETEDRRPKDEKGNLKYCPKRNETEMPTIIEDPIAIRGGVTVKFVSENYELGAIDGEVEQYTKYTKTTDMVTAKPKIESGGIFVGWECSYGGVSDVNSSQITYTVPQQLSEEITEITVTAKFKQAGISVSKASVALDEGEATTLSANITEGFQGDRTITWSTSNDKIAKVDSNGKVTAVGSGTTKITASALGGKLQASCTVTVAATLQKIEISAPEAAKNVKAGDAAFQLKVVAVPEGATVSNVEWSSSDEKIASVDPVTGIVKPLKAGKVTITVKIKGREMKATYELEIKDDASSSSSDSSSESSSSSSSSGSSSESTSSSASASTAETCSVCGQPKTDACNATYCTKCASHAGHDASAHCVDCGTVGHASKADAACSQYVAPVTTCSACGQTKTDACNATYCTKCASHAGHDASAHCVDCGTVGHASKADAACSQYVAPVVTCSSCGQTQTDACNAAYCTICASHAGHTAADLNCGTCGAHNGHNDGCTAA